MIDEHIHRRLIEADLAELEGQGGSELARRVREDPEVRALARKLTAAMRDADRALAGLAEDRSAGITLRGRQATPRKRQRSPRVRSRARPAMAAIGLAAAAVATVMIARTAVQPRPEVALPANSVTASLEVSSSRPFAVFATDNPDIAVVWLFDEEER